MKNWVLIVSPILAIIIILAAVIAINTVLFVSKQLPAPTKVIYVVDRDAAAARLSGAIRYKTVFNEDISLVDYDQFTQFQGYLEKSFPLTHSKLERNVINNHGLLYVWKGSDQSLKPILLLAHQDVVPASAEGWQYPPFAGTVAEGYVWGRGSLDDKCSVMGILEGVEYLLSEDLKPARSIYLAFGFDEEVSGHQGAGKIAEYLKSKGLEFECIIDEGEILLTGAFPTISGPVALVGTAEKGYLSLELSADSEGGHASMPPRQTTVGIVASAIDKLQKKPFPVHMSGPTGDMFNYVGREMKPPYNVIFANMWLLGSILEGQLTSSPSDDATVRTTIAPTMFQGSQRDNVLPSHASAVVNLRLMPGDSIEATILRVKTTINDPRVSVKIYGQGSREPSPIASTTSWAFMTLNKTIRQIFPEAVVAPALATSATDSSRYVGLSPSTLRFVPQRFAPKDLKIIHGIDERVSISNYAEVIDFYIQLIRNSSS